jgi:hypothetical protein
LDEVRGKVSHDFAQTDVRSSIAATIVTLDVVVDDVDYSDETVFCDVGVYIEVDGLQRVVQAACAQDHQHSDVETFRKREKLCVADEQREVVRTVTVH